jgi:triphosphoribosyl-dephospho-CoA synthase
MADMGEFMQPFSRLAAHHAVRALYAEVTLEPKPGLVSLHDNGSHTDMTAATFVRSLFALRNYFPAITQAGFEGSPFCALQALGLAAESRMLRATGGVNTHRGAVFALGLLCAAAGNLHRKGKRLTPEMLRECLQARWGEALHAQAAAALTRAPTSHGQRAARAYGLRSALDEAADGFPTLFETTLPALQNALSDGFAPRAARVQALFATMAVLDDTNVAHRGGSDGLDWLKDQAAAFLQSGGVAQPDWLAQARAFHARCVQRRLSPGGAADVLACACWVHSMHEGAGQGRQPVAAGIGQRGITENV